MPPAKPPFASGRDWIWGSSRNKKFDGKVYRDRDTGREYVIDDNPLHDHWHEIDPIRREYRAVDPITGKPVKGHEGNWRTLR